MQAKIKMKNQIARQIVSLVTGLVLVMFSGIPALAQSAAVANLFYFPSSKTVYVDKQFSIDIKVNTGGEDVGGVDALFTYDPVYLSAPTIDLDSGDPAGNRLINSGSRGTTSDGKTIWAVSWLVLLGTDPDYLNTASGQIATISFTPLKVGTTTLGFHYTGEAGDSTISDTEGNDIISSSNGTATLTIQAQQPIGSDPVITSIVPTSGDSDFNQTIAIYGDNFGDYVAGESKVYLGTKLVDVLDWTDTRIEILIPAEPDLEKNSTRQVKVHRSDGAEATYTGYTLVASGPEVFIWGGIVLLALALSWLTYRKLAYRPQIVASAETSVYPASNISYRF